MPAALLEQLSTAEATLARGDLFLALAAIHRGSVALQARAEAGLLTADENRELAAAIQRCLKRAMSSLDRLGAELRMASSASAAQRSYARAP